MSELSRSILTNTPTNSTAVRITKVFRGIEPSGRRILAAMINGNNEPGALVGGDANNNITPIWKGIFSGAEVNIDAASLRDAYCLYARDENPIAWILSPSMQVNDCAVQS